MRLPRHRENYRTRSSGGAYIFGHSTLSNTVDAVEGSHWFAIGNRLCPSLVGSFPDFSQLFSGHGGGGGSAAML